MTDTTAFRYTTADVAEKLGCTSRTVRERAKTLGLGIDLSGQAGYRFSDADVAALVEALRPVAAPVTKRRRRRPKKAAA